jgi:topoisomerase-4 subunit B
MPPLNLRETTMDPRSRVLLRVQVPDGADAESDGADEARRTATLVESLMGRKPELRYNFIQENAQFVRDLDI